MPGFGAAVRAAGLLAISAFIAALVNRILTPMIDYLKQSPVVTANNTPPAVTRTVQFVEAASNNLLLVLMLSVLVLFLTRSYLNSEVDIG